MLGQFEKLYEKIKKNPRDVKFEEIDKLLINYGGFKRRDGKGSHYVYKHPMLTDIKDYLTIPKAKPVKQVYILKALKLLDKVKLL